jgi:predicted aldo/keto reductase-like oxidoreductase
MSRDATGMQAELEASLRDLATDRIDLYQLHALGSDEQLAQVLGPDGAMATLDRARQAGQVRFVGVTGHSRPVLEKAVRSGAFDTVQLPFNPLETDWLGDVVPAARELDVGIIGMKPVAGGALAELALPSMRFALDRGVDVVIPGFDRLEQVAENARAGTDFRAPNDAELAAFEREKERWQGHFCRRCGYCKPCPNGLEIPLLLLIEAYYTRYELRDWALERLAPLEQQYADCAACGECVERCPYDLPVPELMEAAGKIVK